MQQENIPIKTGVLDLLRNSVGSQYVIPAYQRNYTWTAGKEVHQLLEDYKAVLKGEYPRHFIGIMIYLERSINTFSRECSIIDGQQRLTTIFLMLYAIKELLLERDLAEEAEQLEQIYLINTHNKDIKFKLKPLVADDEVYQQIINRDFSNIKRKDSNVYRNFKYIKEQLNILANIYPLAGTLLESINKLYLVCVPISSDDNPQKIFESINATGIKLTASDLIRNYILMPIESEKQDTYYKKYWKRLEELVSNDSKKLESFFRFFIIAKTQARVTKNGVYDAFKQWYESNKNLGIEGLFCEIVNYATYYHTIYNKSLDSVDLPLRKSLQEFRYIASDMPASLLMELFSLYSQKDNKGKSKLSGKQLSEIIDVLNSYLMRRALCGMDTSDISNYFPVFLSTYMKECNGNYKNAVALFKKNLIDRNKGNKMEMPDDKTMYDKIMNANMYGLRIPLFIFFRKLEMQNNPAPIDFSKLSVEHLMPQTPTEKWYSALKVDKEKYEQNLHRLGNLTLATRPDNSKMQNKPWEYKNAILKDTAHIKMNQELLELDKWTIKEIEKRTKALISKMIELYPYAETKSEITRIPLHLQLEEAVATATYYPDNGEVVVDEGSILVTNEQSKDKYPDIEEARQKLLEEGVIAEKEGTLQFVQQYTFIPKRADSTALSIAAKIISGTNANGWSKWRLENGESIDSTREK